MQTVTARGPGGEDWMITRSWIAPRWRERRGDAGWDIGNLDLSPVNDDSLLGLVVGIGLVLLFTVGVVVFLTVLWPLLLLLLELAIVVPLVFLRRYRLAARDSRGNETGREVRGWRRSRDELRAAIACIERGEQPFAA